MATKEDRNRENQRAYYYRQDEGQDHPNNWFVHRRKVYERILATGKMPQRGTIEKYGIVIEGNKVIVPEDLRKPKGERLVVVTPMKVPSVQEIEEWLKENKETSENTKKKYGSLRQLLEKTGKSLADTIKDIPALVEDIKKHYATAGTRTDKAKFILLALDEYPEFKSKIDTTPLKEFIVQQKKEYDLETEKRRAEIKPPNWEQVLVKVKEKYGEKSPENLFFRLYDEVPVRNDFADMTFGKETDGNYIVGNKAVIQNGKTGGKYGKQEYTLSPGLVSLLNAVPFPKMDSKFVKGVWETLGFKIQNGTIWNDLRHAVITWRNSDENKTKPKGATLASLMRHAVGTQLGTYENGGFQEA